MDLLEDIFKRKGSHRHHDHHHGYYDHPYHQGRTRFFSPKFYLLRGLLSNKKFLVLSGLILGVVFIGGLLLILVMLPHGYKFFHYISQDGLKGVYEWLMAFINRLGEGGGKTCYGFA